MALTGKMGSLNFLPLCVMDIKQILEFFRDQVPFLITIVMVVLCLLVAHWYWIKRHKRLGAEQKLPRQLWLTVLTVIAVLLLVLLLPLSDTTRGQILSLIGILLTGIIALSSTTFVANAMAGLMLRSINTFIPGDYIRLDDQIGRVTERGLFHTEVQNENRDLVTFPNLYLVTHPVTVIHRRGTMLSCTLSLGYDVPKELAERHLTLAAKKTGLVTPLVLIKSLGDYSITYKVSGFLEEVKHLMTWRSKLHSAVLDSLHGAGIEIVSPTFMNQRQYPKEEAFTSPSSFAPNKITRRESAAEDIIFDKAEEASQKEHLRSEVEQVALELEKAKSDNNKPKIQELKQLLESLEQKVEIEKSSEN